MIDPYSISFADLSDEYRRSRRTARHSVLTSWRSDSLVK